MSCIVQERAFSFFLHERIVCNIMFVFYEFLSVASGFLLAIGSPEMQVFKNYLID